MTGVGRGRGWLNIKREEQAPGGIMTTTTITATEEDPIQKYLGYIDNISDIPAKYAKALQEFESISDKDMFLKKIEDFQYNNEDIHECVLFLGQKYLVDWNFGNQAIDNAFNLDKKAIIMSAQNMYENRTYLFRKNKVYLVKVILLLTRLFVLRSFFNYAHAVFESSLLILEPVHDDYIPMLTRCFHQVYNSLRITANSIEKISYMQYLATDRTGGSYRHEFARQKIYITASLRAAICSMNVATTRYWLFLALDIMNHGPQILPEDTLAFYAKHLGEDEMNYFRKVPSLESPLYLDTNQSLYSLDKHVSGVRVLKIDDSVKNGRADDMNSATPMKQQHSDTTHNSHPSSGTSDSHSPWIETKHKKQQPAYEKQQQQQQQQSASGGGRAILGSGARNKRNSKQAPQKQNVHGERQYGGDQQQHHRVETTGKPPPPDLSRNHNAWNHDDRC